MPDIAAFTAELAGVEQSTDAALLRQKSRDFYWYSPILKRQLDGKRADIWLRPQNEDEVMRILNAARRHGVPITVRGGATGNYGQCVPLNAGAVLDTTAMTAPIALKDGVLEAEAGARMIDLDLWARERGWELRLWPSTKRTATIAGFVAGGGAGVGGISHGTMRERGNLLGVRVATLQDPPALLDLEGDAANPVNRTYGTTGVITRVRLPLTPAQDWRDIAVAFSDFAAAGRFALALAFADGIPKKMCAVFDARLPPFFRAIADVVPADHALALVMVAPSGLVALRDMARDRGVTYLQCRFPFEGTLESVGKVRAAFPDEVWMHTECVRFGGRTTMTALPVIRWKDDARLAEIMAGFEAAGAGIANPHVFTIEEGSGYRRVPGDQLGFKRRVDPLGLFNPGKMKSFDEPESDAA
jgi:FAD/FMN-containing dehydrogenase